MRKILVIDDDWMVQREVHHALARDNYQILAAETPSEGIALAQKEQPALILLDMIMPEMDGICVLRQLREDPATSNIPVIVVTSLNAQDQIDGCLEEGAVGHLSKPFEHHILSARVASCLLQRKLSDFADEMEDAPAHPKPPKHRGWLTAFLGVKGGVGTTTLAANVASIAAQHNQSAILCELRATSGTLAFQFNTESHNHLGTFLSDLKKGTKPDIENYLTRASNGLRLLFGPQAGDHELDLTAAEAESLVDNMRSLADSVYLDLSTGLTKANVAILTKCDNIVLVLDHECTSIASAKCLVDQLQHLVVRHAIKAIVIRRSALSTAPSLEVMHSFLDCDLLGVIPCCADGMEYASRTGTPLAALRPEDDIALGIQELTKKDLLPPAHAVQPAVAHA